MTSELLDPAKAADTTKKIKVAVLTEIPTPYREPLFEQFAKESRLDLTVFYCASTEVGRDWAFAKTENVKRRNLNGFRWTFRGNDIFTYKANPGIWHELSAGNYDVVIICGYAHLTMQLAALWCFVHGVPYVLNSESHLLKHRGLLKKIIKYPIAKLMIQGASACLPTGTNALDYLVHYGARREKAFLFPNTPDVTVFSQESQKYRTQKEEIKKNLGIKTTCSILFTGRLVAVKGFDYLLDAFRKLKQDGLPVSLLICGNGPLEETYRSQVKQFGLDNVHFLGVVPYSELPKMYAISDVFVLPSWSEPWGAVLNEAAACGLPIVTTRAVGGARDLVLPGKNGFVVKERNSREIYEAVKELLQNESMRLSFANNSAALSKKWGYELCLESFKRAVEIAHGHI